MRVLVLTKIFPNAVEPLSSPFNRQQFAALGRRCEVEVLATIPWYPGARFFRRWSAAGRLVAAPAAEIIGGLPVSHPRFLSPPRAGRALAGPLYAASLLGPVVAARRPDVLLGSWCYPDGWATVVLGRLLGLPAVVKLHGSDVHVVARMPGPRRQLRWALPRAERVVAVSGELADEAVALGVPRDRVVVVRSGVDTSIFHPADRDEARAALGLPRAAAGRLILYVGRLEAEKGVDDLLAAFALLVPRREDVSLALVGDGSAIARCRGAGARVLAPGALPPVEVARWIAACDVLALPSWNEGLPNVVLEALASGRRVVATRVGGIPEIVTTPEAGELVAPRDPAGLAEALERVLARRAEPVLPHVIAGVDGWPESAARLERVLADAIELHARRQNASGQFEATA